MSDLRLVHYSRNPVSMIAQVARVSRGKFGQGDPHKDAELVQKLRSWGHLSPFEFAWVTVETTRDALMSSQFQPLLLQTIGWKASTDGDRALLTVNARHLIEFPGTLAPIVRLLPESWRALVDKDSDVRPWSEVEDGEQFIFHIGLDSPAVAVEYVYGPPVHFSIWRKHAHCVVTWDGASRACLNQLVRHRKLSFIGESQRTETASARRLQRPPVDDYAKKLFNKIEHQAKTAYLAAVASGTPPEDARYLLPIGWTSRMVWAGSILDVIQMARLRLAPSAQREIRLFTLRTIETLSQHAGLGDLADLVERARQELTGWF